MSLAKLLVELIKIVQLFSANKKSRELANALKKARVEKDTSELERIFNPNKLPDEADQKTEPKP
jgi:hypothetical protein